MVCLPCLKATFTAFRWICWKLKSELAVEVQLLLSGPQQIPRQNGFSFFKLDSHPQSHTHACISIFVKAFIGLMYYLAPYPNHYNYPPDPNLNPILTSTLKPSLNPPTHTRTHTYGLWVPTLSSLCLGADSRAGVTRPAETRPCPSNRFVSATKCVSEGLYSGLCVSVWESFILLKAQFLGFFFTSDIMTVKVALQRMNCCLCCQ